MATFKIEIPAGEYGRLKVDAEGVGTLHILGDRRIPIDLRKIHPRSWPTLIGYGIGRKVTDGNSPDTKDEKGNERSESVRLDEAVALASATLQSVYDGVLANRGTAARLPENVVIARTFIIRTLVKAGVKVAKIPTMSDMDQCRKVAEAAKMKWALVEAEVKRQLEAAKELPELDITAFN